MKQERIEKILTQTKNIYNSIAPDFSNTRGKWWQGFGSFNKYVKPGDRVLDLGCGNGRIAEIFADSEIEYLGIDNSKELIEIARERFKDKNWIKFEVGDALSFDWIPNQVKLIRPLAENDKYDLIMILAVLHHIPTRSLRLKVLKNAYKILKPGGRLITSNWNLFQTKGINNKKFRYWSWLLNYKQKIKRGVWSPFDALVPWKPLSKNNLRYVHAFRKGEMKRLLKQTGFKIESNEFENKNGKVTNIWQGDNLLTVAIKK